MNNKTPNTPSPQTKTYNPISLIAYTPFLLYLWVGGGCQSQKKETIKMDGHHRRKTNADAYRAIVDLPVRKK